MSSGASISAGESTSNSNNQSVLVPQPALGYEGQWNSALQSLQNQQYQWAQQQYGKNSALTDQMVSDANNYANPERIHQDMGSAEAGVAQGMDAQRQALNQTLQSYGINPGDPKYAGALAASRTAQGAAEAAAGQTANRADVATGHALKQAAFGDVQQNTNTGANILGTSQGYAGEGVQNVKFAPLGQVGQSTSQSQNASQSVNNSSSPAGGGGGGGASQPKQPSQGGGGGGQGPEAGGGGGAPGGYNSNYGTNGQIAGGDPSGGDQYANEGGYYDPALSVQNNPYTNQDSYYNGEDPNFQNYGGGTGSSGYNDYGEQPNGGDYSGYNDAQSGGYDASEDFAAGGEVRGGIPSDATQGGFVSRRLSPSRGAIVDDVPANLNADEFVMPRDVTHWYGKKFFHGLIDKARTAQQGSASPQQKPMQMKDAVTTMRGGRPQAFGGGAIPDGGQRPLMQRNVA